MHFITIKRSSIVAVLVLALALIGSIVGVALTGTSSVYFGKTTKKLPIYCVQTDEKVVALSFDAAWGSDSTQKILDTLTEYDIKANYFVVSFWAEKYADLLKSLSDSGRVEVGTHSVTHPHMAQKSRSEIALELSDSVKTIESITGKKVELFRPPFGEYTDTVIEECEKQGLYPIQWDVDTLDWKGISAEQIAARVVNNVTNGSIVLMHNDGANTAAALPAIITALKDAGYTFKTIGELIYRDNYTIDHTGKQIKNAA